MCILCVYTDSLKYLLSQVNIDVAVPWGNEDSNADFGQDIQDIQDGASLLSPQDGASLLNPAELIVDENNDHLSADLEAPIALPIPVLGNHYVLIC